MPRRAFPVEKIIDLFGPAMQVTMNAPESLLRNFSY